MNTTYKENPHNTRLTRGNDVTINTLSRTMENKLAKIVRGVDRPAQRSFNGQVVFATGIHACFETPIALSRVVLDKNDNQNYNGVEFQNTPFFITSEYSIYKRDGQFIKVMNDGSPDVILLSEEDTYEFYN